MGLFNQQISSHVWLSCMFSVDVSPSGALVSTQYLSATKKTSLIINKGNVYKIRQMSTITFHLWKCPTFYKRDGTLQDCWTPTYPPHCGSELLSPKRLWDAVGVWLIFFLWEFRTIWDRHSTQIDGSRTWFSQLFFETDVFHWSQGGSKATSANLPVSSP